MCSMSFGLFLFFHTIPDLRIIELSSLNNADLTLSRHRENGEAGRGWGLRCYRFQSEGCRKPPSCGSQRDSSTSKVSNPKPEGIFSTDRTATIRNQRLIWLGRQPQKRSLQNTTSIRPFSAVASTVIGTSNMRDSS
jgi:hypothetical protein